jgi:hypothetical protein
VDCGHALSACLGAAVEIVSRTTTEVGAEIAGKNGEFSAGRRNARAKRQKDVDSFTRITAHFMGYREINGISRRPFMCLMAVLPVLKRPAQLQCRLGEDPFSCPSRR